MRQSEADWSLLELLLDSFDWSGSLCHGVPSDGRPEFRDNPTVPELAFVFAGLRPDIIQMIPKTPVVG